MEAPVRGAKRTVVSALLVSVVVGSLPLLGETAHTNPSREQRGLNAKMVRNQSEIKARMGIVSLFMERVKKGVALSGRDLLAEKARVLEAARHLESYKP